MQKTNHARIVVKLELNILNPLKNKFRFQSIPEISIPNFTPSTAELTMPPV
jgi:hypothetical protein